MIKFENVTKKYDDVKALDEFSWEVKKGEIHALLGHNGSDKTTSFLIANKLTNFNGGNVYLFDKNVSSLHKKDVQKIGLLTDKLKVYEDLTIKETLSFFCDIFSILNKKSKIDEISKLFGFNEYIDRQIKNLSTGMYKKVVIALTLINNPEIVFLDEPFSGLDPVIVKQISNILKQYKIKNDTTIIVSSHNLDEIEQIADTITIMKKGKNIVSKSIDELYNSCHIQKSYSLSYIKLGQEFNEHIEDEQVLSDRLIELRNENVVVLKVGENKVKLVDIYKKIYE